MTQPTPLDYQTALIYIMVLSAAVDGDMSDREMMTMGSMVERLPVFDGFEKEKLPQEAESCVSYLNGEAALDDVLTMIGEALPKKLVETAYAVACQIVACDKKAGQEELRLLEMIRHKFGIDRLVAAAIERGIAVLNRTL